MRTVVEERGPFILRNKVRFEPDHVHVADGGGSTFNLQVAFARRFPTRAGARSTLRELPIPRPLEPADSQARATESAAGELLGQHEATNPTGQPS